MVILIVSTVPTWTYRFLAESVFQRPCASTTWFGLVLVAADSPPLRALCNPYLRVSSPIASRRKEVFVAWRICTQLARSCGSSMGGIVYMAKFRTFVPSILLEWAANTATTFHFIPVTLKDLSTRSTLRLYSLWKISKERLLHLSKFKVNYISIVYHY